MLLILIVLSFSIHTDAPSVAAPSTGKTVAEREYSPIDKYHASMMIVSGSVLAVFFLILLLSVVSRRLNQSRAALARLSSQLESRVQERTRELASHNTRLREEISERSHIEEVLRLNTKRLEELEVQLREQAIRDPLTRLYNSRFMFEALDREMERTSRYRYPLCLMMMDLDYFKAINDTYGHPTGDEVLQKLTGLLEDGTRKGDILCRYGGDEFVVIMPQVTISDAEAHARRLRLTIQDTPFQVSAESISVTVTIGLACTTGARFSSVEFLSHADKMLYTAKEAGRNRVAAEPDEHR